MYMNSKTIGPSLVTEMANEADQVADHHPESAALIKEVLPETNIGTTPVAPSSLFSKNCAHITDDQTTVFTVAITPHFAHVPSTTVANSFNMPDLQAALGNCFVLNQSYSSQHGQRRSRSNCSLHSDQIHVWTLFCMQPHFAQDSQITLPVQTIQALPPSSELPFGCRNTVMVGGSDGDTNSGA